MTTILRATAPHEFLAAIPALAGYRPERSLVCVPFTAARTSGLLRYDLPNDEETGDAVASAAVGVICRMREVDAIVPIAYTDALLDRCAVEQIVLMRCIARARDAGYIVHDAFLVAADAWTSILHGEGERHPLSLIGTAALGTEAGLVAEETALDTQPPVDVGVSAAVEAALAELVRMPDAGMDEVGDRFDDDGLLGRLASRVDPVVFAEHLLCTEADAGTRADADDLAWLAHLARIPSLRDALMLQFAFGPVIGELALEQSERMRLEQDHDPGRAIARNRDGESDDDAQDDLVMRLLLGESTVRPDVERVRRAIAVLMRAVAHTPPAFHPGLLCVAAWNAWSLGRGSAAGRLLDRALDEVPGHPMAELLRTFIGSGAVPEWAFSTGESVQ